MKTDNPNWSDEKLAKQLRIYRWMTFAKKCREVHLAVCGRDEMARLGVDVVEVLMELRAQAEVDANLLKLPLPLEEALAIWERARDFVQLETEIFRAGLGLSRWRERKAFLAEREAAMARLRERMM